MKDSTKGLFMVILSGIVYGVMPGAVTFCYSQGATKELLLFCRYLIIALLLAGRAFRPGNMPEIFKKSGKSLLALSCFGAGTSLLLFAAYNYLPTGVATSLHFLYPTFVALLCFFLFREKLSKLNLLCLILSIGGIALLFDLSGSSLSLKGILIAAASGLAWAGYIVLLGKARFSGADSFQIMFYDGVISCVLVLLYALLTGGFSVSLTPAGWIAVILTSLVTSVFGLIFFAIGVRKTSAQVSAIASTLEPITSVLVGVLFLHETLTFRSALGSVLILTAVVLLAVFEKKKD